MYGDLQYEKKYAEDFPFNGEYDFEFMAIGLPRNKADKTKPRFSDRTFNILLMLEGKSKVPLQPPQQGMQIELRVTLDRNAPETLFVGRVIPAPLNSGEFDVLMMVTRTAGNQGFAYTAHRGSFRFGPRGGATRAVRKAVRSICTAAFVSPRTTGSNTPYSCMVIFVCPRKSR